MKSPKSLAVLSVVLVILLSFNRVEKKSKLDLNTVNVMAMLSEQELGQRPSHNYMFYVKTEINKLVNTEVVNAKVYVLNRKTNEETIIAQENLELTDFQFIEGMGITGIQNLNVVNTTYDTPYNFYDLLKFESIYRNFVDATNRLL